MFCFFFCFFFVLFFFKIIFCACVCALYYTKISVPNIHEVGQFFKIHILTKSMCFLDL